MKLERLQSKIILKLNFYFVMASGLYDWKTVKKVVIFLLFKDYHLFIILIALFLTYFVIFDFGEFCFSLIIFSRNANKITADLNGFR